MPPNAVAQIALTANPGALSTGLNAAYRMVASFAKLSAQTLQGLQLAPKMPKNGNGFSVARAALGTAVGMYTKRGIDLLVDQGKQIFEFNDDLVRFGIAARISGTQLDYVGRMARQVGSETGIASNEVLRGARAYVDMAGAAAFSVDKMAMLAQVAQATKASTADLAQVMFQLQRSMKVGDKDLENTFGGVINMSKDGAVHFSQMAQEISELAPQAARYGMVGREGVNQLTALMQVARTGFGSVSEMGTGITRVFSGLTMHADKFEKYGVRIFDVAKDGTKHWRKFSAIFNDINSNKVLSKDPFLLRKVFGRSEADRTIRLWMEGTAALRDLEKAGEANGVVQRDLATYSESAAGRIAIAMEKTKNAVAEAFTPERIQRFVSAIEDLGQKMGGLAEAVGKIGDGMSWIYAQGKKLRGWVGNNGQMKAYFDPTEIAAYQRSHGYAGGARDRNGVSAGYARAYLEMTTDRDKANSLIKDVGTLLRDDKTTPASNRRAMQSFLHSAAGSDERMAADSYFGEAGLDTKQMRALLKEVVDDEIKSARGAPGGEQQMAVMADFVNEIGNTAKYLTGAAPTDHFLNPPTSVDVTGALNRFVTTLANFREPTTVITMDGNRVGQSINDATNARRR